MTQITDPKERYRNVPDVVPAGRFVSNYLNPCHPHWQPLEMSSISFHQNIRGMSDEKYNTLVEKMIADELKDLERFDIGPPQGSEKYTSEELAKGGFIGLYAKVT